MQGYLVAIAFALGSFVSHVTRLYGELLWTIFILGVAGVIGLFWWKIRKRRVERRWGVVFSVAVAVLGFIIIAALMLGVYSLKLRQTAKQMQWVSHKLEEKGITHTARAGAVGIPAMTPPSATATEPSAASGGAEEKGAQQQAAVTAPEAPAPVVVPSEKSPAVTP